MYNNLIAERLKKNEPSSKMAQMAEKSAAGGMTSFNGLFQVSELSENEKAHLESILKTYAKNESGIKTDLKDLIALTAEVKAINHQAALLHGERIKKVHTLLTSYQEGAFTSWLIAAYGNRQTPYNLMQYFNFYQAVPSSLRPKIETMPRQAIYTLATREGEMGDKIEFITRFQGETKTELLLKIRDLFPLKEKDKRRENAGNQVIVLFEKGKTLLSRKSTKLSSLQKETLKELLASLNSLLKAKDGL
jgi:hypothetical protein